MAALFMCVDVVALLAAGFGSLSLFFSFFFNFKIIHPVGICCPFLSLSSQPIFENYMFIYLYTKP